MYGFDARVDAQERCMLRAIQVNDSDVILFSTVTAAMLEV